ncbi:HDOD domain-containing protein [Marinomonas pollencensis]|uniref:HD-like signal output (HDOD) protein n=1 Tax=Marinomonas pollencensis TaxID=491954 RepID=A0A3E0DFX0_9GAMM|nr:HDOD domain-containing protein [Marinomonas pollencensis]REG81616.1 HD-like signal output (HDOD) protein [Marinomonas pollencensis]
MQRPMNDKSPYGLNKWLRFLKEHKLPVRSENLASLKKHISHPDATIENLQTKIKHQPMVAFALLNQANKIIPNKRGEIKNPYHAGSMLGINGIKQSLATLAPYQHDNNNPAHRAFLQEIQTSYEAAGIAQRWSVAKSTEHEEIFWLTFFRNAARWLMWFFAQPTMERLQGKLRAGENAAHAEVSVLGCRIDEITVHMCKYWHAPRAIIESFLTSHVPNNEELKTLARLSHTPDQLPGFIEDKRLTILANSPLMFVYCANKLIQEALLHGWQGNTLHFYYRVIATITHDYLGKAIQSAHLGCAEAATLYLNTAKAPLACQLLSPTLYLPAVKQTKPKTKAPRSALDKLKTQLANPTLTTKEKLNLALKTIKISIPNAEQAILLKHSEGKISPAMQYGQDVAMIKKVKWNMPSPLFEKLVRKRSAIHCQGRTLVELINDLPYLADSLIDKNGQLMLASTPISATETGIFWLVTAQQFNNKDYSTLKKIVMLISHNPR